jgi:hypothetical protein
MTISRPFRNPIAIGILPLILFLLLTSGALARSRLESTLLKYAIPSGGSAGGGGHGQKSSFPEAKRTCIKRDRLVMTRQGFVRRKVDVCT